MPYSILIILIVVLFFFLALKEMLNKYSVIYNMPVESLDGRTYSVHRAHNNTVEAARIFSVLNSKAIILIQHLKKKYSADYTTKPEPTKSNRIDIIPISSDGNLSYERAQLLISRFKSSSIIENSPLNGGQTSYTENKGATIALCIRNKKNPDQFHDINTLTYVMVHELAHVANVYFGHDDRFWKTFLWLLRECIEAKIYSPVDYSKSPIEYCGIIINYNPIYDRSL